MEWSTVPMYELYKNLNLSPNPFIIVPDDDDDSDDDSVFKFPPPAKYRKGNKFTLSPSSLAGYKQCIRVT